MSFQQSLSVEYKFTVFHRYMICQENLVQAKKKMNSNIKYSGENPNNSCSTVYKCRLAPDDLKKDYGNFFVMKVVSYLKNNQKKPKQFKPPSPHLKAYQQIQTEYIALKMLSKCHRIAKFKQMIHQNVHRADDKQFFYNFLGKPKNSNQRYLCMVTEYCNEGDLDTIVRNKHHILTEEEVISYAAQIVEGLYQLKKKRIIHRDLRLCNILVHNGEIKFSDFDSAFIGGKSTWKDVKNGIDIETSPPQIIQLASKPDQQLQKYAPEDLYQHQQKSDIYFFGLALFKMIYGYNYQKFNSQVLSNMISQKLATSKYNRKMLNLLISCLEEKAEKRIDLAGLYRGFVEVERVKYFVERTVGRLYLSEEPICFSASKNIDGDSQIVFKNQQLSLKQSTSAIFSQLNFQKQLKKSQTQHLTQLHSHSYPHSQLQSYWQRCQTQIFESRKFIESMQNFIRTISVRTYYYECLYKAILSINTVNLSIKQDIKFVKESKGVLQRQLAIVLAFLFKLLFKTPFIRDKRYCAQDLPYEAMKLFKNIIKSDFIQNKMHCYYGKTRQFQFNRSKTTKKITQFFNKRYETQDSFEPVYKNILKLVTQIDNNLQSLLKLTIINLRIAYNNINQSKQPVIVSSTLTPNPNQLGPNTSNIKQILFILITLQQITLSKIKKNQMIIMWDRLLPLLNEQVELDQTEAEIVFEQYRSMYAQEHLEVSGQHIEDSVFVYSVDMGLGGDEMFSIMDGVEGSQGKKQSRDGGLYGHNKEDINEQSNLQANQMRNLKNNEQQQPQIFQFAQQPQPEPNNQVYQYKIITASDKKQISDPSINLNGNGNEKLEVSSIQQKSYVASSFEQSQMNENENNSDIKFNGSDKVQQGELVKF